MTFGKPGSWRTQSDKLYGLERLNSLKSRVNASLEHSIENNSDNESYLDEIKETHTSALIIIEEIINLVTEEKYEEIKPSLRAFYYFINDSFLADIEYQMSIGSTVSSLSSMSCT